MPPELRLCAVFALSALGTAALSLTDAPAATSCALVFNCALACAAAALADRLVAPVRW